MTYKVSPGRCEALHPHLGFPPPPEVVFAIWNLLAHFGRCGSAQLTQTLLNMAVPLPQLGLAAALVFRDLRCRVHASFFSTCPACVCVCTHTLQQCPPFVFALRKPPAASMRDFSETKKGTFWVFPYSSRIGIFDIAITITIRNKRERTVSISLQ